MRLSIIIPAYNAEKTIADCIHSIERKNKVDFEIVVVNDGSTDRTEDICRGLAQQYSNINLISIQNGGVSHARNVGLDRARGRYVQFVDSDDYIDSEMCSCMLERAEEEQAQIVICGFEREFYQNGKVLARNRISCKDRLIAFNELEKDFPELLIKGYLNPPWNKLYLKETLDPDVRFPENLSLGEDLLFNLDVLNKSQKICILSGTWYHNIESNENSLTRKFKPDRQQDNLAVYYGIKKFCSGNGYHKDAERINGKIFLRTDYINLEQLVFNSKQLSKTDYRKFFDEIVLCKETRESLKLRYGKDWECIFYKLFLTTKNRKLIEFSVWLRVILKKQIRKIRGRV